MDSCYSLPFLLPRGLALCLFSFFFLGFPFRCNLGFCSFSLGWVVGRLRWRWPPAQSRLLSCRTFTWKDLAIASRPASRAGSDRALAAVRTKNHLTRINHDFIKFFLSSFLQILMFLDMKLQDKIKIWAKSKRKFKNSSIRTRTDRPKFDYFSSNFSKNLWNFDALYWIPE